MTLDSGRHTWSVADWSDPAIAKKVVGGSGINPTTFLQKLTLPPGQQENPKGLKTSNLKPATLTFTYEAFSHPTLVSQIMQRYLKTVLASRVANLNGHIPGAIKGFTDDATAVKTHDPGAVSDASGSPAHHEYVHDNQAATTLKDMRSQDIGSMIRLQGIAKITQTTKPLNVGLAALGGAVVGFLAGILMLLALRWGRGRITDASELIPLDRRSSP